MRRGVLRELLYLLGVMIAMQLLRFLLKQLVFAFTPRTMETDVVASTIAMVLLTAVFLGFARWRRAPLSVFPQFRRGYILATLLAAALLIGAPSNYTDGMSAILPLVYGSIVTPVYEELIFRGYVWNRLRIQIRREWVVALLTAALFGLWHLGYWDSLALRVQGVDERLSTIMALKALTGLGYGLVLGAVRLWAKNCYATMLLHGVMNLFGR